MNHRLFLTFCMSHLRSAKTFFVLFIFLTATSVRAAEPVEQEVSFKSSGGKFKLAGTLTLPAAKGKYPAVILISGSGPQNRDSELMGHRPFKVMADYFAARGIAVLRFDDRGTGNSGGQYNESTTYDFVNDALGALAFLQKHKGIQSNQIGMIGHSEGASVAAIAAGRAPQIAFVVMMAGPGIRGAELLLLQKQRIELAMGIPEEQVMQSQNLFKKVYDVITSPYADLTKMKETLNQKVPDVFGDGLPPIQAAMLVQQLSNPWMVTFMRTNPPEYLAMIQCPVLAINGERDLQVPFEENLPAIEKGVRDGGNTRITIRSFPGLNHLFQECETGLPKEYAQKTPTPQVEVIDAITEWILGWVR